MDFKFTPEQEQLRREVREFALRPDIQNTVQEIHKLDDHFNAFSKEVYEELGSQGWLAIHWPKQYGGEGKTLIEATIVQEELLYHGVSMGPYGLTIGIFGNALLHIGSEEQRVKYLPGIAKGKTYCCILYTEPNAGSDLASLVTKAVKDGDDYVINGTKIFTSQGHLAHYGLLAARTNPNVPKHKGISAFILDMKSPGITINPMIALSGERVNEISLEDVRIPAGNMVGEPEKGWMKLNEALAVERTSAATGWVTEARRMLDHICRYVKEKGLGTDKVVRLKLARLETRWQIAHLLLWRSVCMTANGARPDSEASMAKLYSTELDKEIIKTSQEIMGSGALVTRFDPAAPMSGEVSDWYLHVPYFTIAAGSSEIMRQMIALRKLQVHK